MFYFVYVVLCLNENFWLLFRLNNKGYIVVISIGVNYFDMVKFVGVGNSCIILGIIVNSVISKKSLNGVFLNSFYFFFN